MISHVYRIQRVHHRVKMARVGLATLVILVNAKLVTRDQTAILRAVHQIHV